MTDMDHLTTWEGSLLQRDWRVAFRDCLWRKLLNPKKKIGTIDMWGPGYLGKPSDPKQLGS